MRISRAAKRKPRVDGHKGAESRISEIEKETAASASARKTEQKKQTPGSAAQGRLRFGLGVRLERSDGCGRRGWR